MGSEAALWTTLKNHLRGQCHSSRHEDTAGLGIPDVSFGINNVNGWIELKYSHEYPKRESTPVRIRHFTKEQRHFLWERGTHGGHCWVLWQIHRDYLLFDHHAVWKLGNIPKNELLALSCQHWQPRLNTAELLDAIQVRK
jgi:hypothetical protein